VAQGLSSVGLKVISAKTGRRRVVCDSQSEDAESDTGWLAGKHSGGDAGGKAGVCLSQGLWRIEYLNTGRANSPKMWAVQFTSGSTSGSSGSKLTLNNNKINT